MSTRGNIAIRLRDEHQNANLVYDPAAGVDTSNGTDIMSKISHVNPGGNRYLQIYNHHDSYPSYLGRKLLNHYMDYDKVLNLILAGDTSGVNNNTTACYVSYGDDYEDTRPAALQDPSWNEEYLYVYEDGKWFVQGHDIETLTELTQDIIDND